MSFSFNLQITFFSILSLGIFNNGYCQDSTGFRKNQVYLEIGGNSPVVSINYERTFMRLTKSDLSYHVGVGFDYMTYEQGNFPVFSTPLEISHILFKASHHLEYGVGFTPFISKVPIWTGQIDDYNQEINENYKVYFLLMPEIGYRYQKENGKWVFKIGYTPVILNTSIDNGESSFLHHGGISVGRKF